MLLHLNYGAELLAFLDQRGDTARLRPWVEALRAHHLGDRRALQNIAPEIRDCRRDLLRRHRESAEKAPGEDTPAPLPVAKRTRSTRPRSRKRRAS